MNGQPFALPKPLPLVGTEACIKGKFARPEGAGENFNCHRRGPTVVMVPAMLPTGQIKPQYVSVWPTVQPTMWCGDYVPHIAIAK